MKYESPLKRLKGYINQLEVNKVNIVSYDSENKFFSVEKNNICGLITCNNFNDDLEVFLSSVEIYKVNENELENFSFNDLTLYQIRDLIIRGFDLSSYLSTLNYNQLKMIYNQ